MPNLTPQQAALQADGAWQLRALSIYKGAVAAEADVTAIPPAHLIEQAATALDVSYTVGSEADVRPGFLVEIRTDTGALRGITRVRYSGAITSSSLPILELSRGHIVVANGDHLIIRREVRLSTLLPAADETFAPDLIPYTDQGLHPNPIPCSGGGGAWKLDAGQTYATVPFFGSRSRNVDPTSTPTNTSHLWGIPSGAGTYAPGSADTDADPVMRLNLGKWLIEHTVTDDDNGKSETQYIPVCIEDESDLLPILCEPLSADLDEGWSYRCRVFDDADLDSIPDGSLVYLWATTESIGGTLMSLGSAIEGRSHIKCVGYIRRETERSERGNSELHFEIIGIGARLAELASWSKVMLREASPDEWAEIAELKTGRAITQLIQSYTNLPQSGIDYTIHDDYLSLDYPALFVNKDNAQAQVRDLAGSTDGRFVCLRSGNFELQPIPVLLDRVTRDGLGTWLTMTPDDWLSIEVEREHWRPVETYYAQGFSAHPTDPSPIFVKWPGTAPGQGVETEKTEKKIYQNEAVFKARVGLLGALKDGWFVDEDLVGHFAPRVRTTHPTSYDFWDFTCEWAVFDYTTPIRGIDLSIFRFYLQSIGVVYNARGTLVVECVWQAETFGEPGVPDPQPQSNTITVQDPNDIWGFDSYETYNGTDLLGNTADIALLTASGLTYTGLFTSSPAWASESWLDGSALDLLDSGETVRDGVQKPSAARTIYTATNTKARVFANALAGTSVSLTYALRAASANGLRLVQAERGDPDICYILTNYTDGLWSEGHLGGVAITPVRIGSSHNETIMITKPAILVDQDNPLIAYAIAWNGSAYQWYKTVNGGVSWSANSDYAWGLGQATFLVRSYLDPSIVYAGAVISAFDAGIYKVTSSAATLLFSDGGWNARGFRTLDRDKNVLLSVRYPFAGIDFQIGIKRSLDQAANFDTIFADTAPQNVGVNGPSGFFGADGSVYHCRADTILFHPNIYNLTDDSQFTDKTGTGYPITGTFVPINLFGGLS